MPKPLDIKVGDVYTRLTVIEEPFSKRSASGRCERFVKCQCSCGTIKVVSLNSLRMKSTKSCGCLNVERASRKRLSDEDRVKNSLSQEYKNSAKQRGLVYEISENFLFVSVKSNCHYCGKPPNKPHRKCDTFLYNGLDRVDNSIGYIASNVVPCCYICNKMKGELPVEVFLEHLNKIWTRVA